MTNQNLRVALRDLGEEARDTDLLDRALATSRQIRLRRVAMAASCTVATLATAAIVGATVILPDAGPATSQTPTSLPTTEPATGAATPSPSTSPKQVPWPGLAGTVYYRQGSWTAMTLYSRTGDEQPRALVTLEHSMAVSPDARRLAWIKLPEDVHRPATLMISVIDGGNTRLLAEADNRGGLCNYPAWSADSRHIVFKTHGAGDGGPWAVIDVDTGERTVLDVASVCYPTWSPDGTTIAWYDGDRSDGSAVVLTDARGGGLRHVPPIDGVPAKCGGSVYAVAPGGQRALVDFPRPESCGGDGPGPTAVRGVIVDTATGKSLRIPVDGGLASGVFLPDGSLLARTAQTGELVLLDPELRVVARAPAPSTDKSMVLLAYAA